MLLENEAVAGSLTLAIIQCLGYPDAYTVRRTTKICHRLLETVAWSTQYADLLGDRMFRQALKNVVTEPKWMVGIEWEMINVARDIYIRLVLGQYLQPGGQGVGLQQPRSAVNPNEFEQTKSADRPLQGGGILTVPSDLPRQVLMRLPGINVGMISQLEADLKRKRSAKDQKDFIRDMLRVVSDMLKEMNPTPTSEGAAAGIFDRAVIEESLLHSTTRPKTVPDLPEKLVINRPHVEKSSRKQQQQET